MRIFEMQDRSAPGTKVDENLTLQQVLNMTDYSDEEVDQVADLQPGQQLILNGWIYVKRIS